MKSIYEDLPAALGQRHAVHRCSVDVRGHLCQRGLSTPLSPARARAMTSTSAPHRVPASRLAAPLAAAVTAARVLIASLGVALAGCAGLPVPVERGGIDTRSPMSPP